MCILTVRTETVSIVCSFPVAYSICYFVTLYSLVEHQPDAIRLFPVLGVSILPCDTHLLVLRTCSVPTVPGTWYLPYHAWTTEIPVLYLLVL
jgi:hypothetical protein